jgi:hypothetical protein
VFAVRVQLLNVQLTPPPPCCEVELALIVQSFKVLIAAPPPVLQLALLLIVQWLRKLHDAPAPVPPEFPRRTQLVSVQVEAAPPKIA